MEMQQSTLALSPSVSSDNISFTSHGLKKRHLILIVLIVGMLMAAAGFLVGYFVKGNVENKGKQTESMSSSTKPGVMGAMELFDQFKQDVSTQELEIYLRYFSQEPHVAGSERQRKLANYLASKWREYEFDEVETVEYKVLLSYPKKEKPNLVSILENGTVVEEIRGQYKASPSPDVKNISLYTPYFAYTPNGTAEGKLVYVNRGTQQDFDELEKRNVSLNGTILLSRNIFATKTTALLAIPKGAKGLLIYPDPAQYVRTSPGSSSTYPNGPWLSSESVQTAQMYTRFGDPLTPGLPALDGIIRERFEDFKDIPPILVQPISYGDALRLFQRLGGDEVPSGWRGGLNITYRFGPGFENSSGTVRLTVNNQLETKPILNVIGTITGREDPDRYVFMGNHRDAWFYGAADASTGISVLAETSRLLGKLLKKGWRPRRTIKLCSFGGEEFGLFGSVEWVEENAVIFKERGVAYLNTDVPVQGNFALLSQTSPLLVDLILKWMKVIKVPIDKEKYETIYDVMVKRAPSPVNPGEPILSTYKFPSDYLPFFFIAGVTAADFSYFFNYDNGRWQLYPPYHTQEDTFYWVKRFADPKFEIHKAMTLLMGAMLLDLAESRIIPFSVNRLKESLHRAYNNLITNKALLGHLGVSTNQVNRSLGEFWNSCKLFESDIREISNTRNVSIMRLRTLNDQLTHVEKAFIDSRIYHPNSVIFKHLAFGDKFDGVLNALSLAQKTNDTREVQRQLSLLSVAISSAAKILRPLKISSETVQ